MNDDLIGERLLVWLALFVLAAAGLLIATSAPHPRLVHRPASPPCPT